MECVLTGESGAQGAHILPVRVTRGGERQLLDVWDSLRCFWPLPALQELAVRGQEATNILPLSPSAHARWDRFEFALRPVAHPTDPTRHLYLQMVWLGRVGQKEPGGLSTLNDEPANDADGRPRMADVRGRCVEHGDVFELVSSDPAAFPLPSFRMLEIQHAVHKLMAGMRAAATLRFIFGGDPPPDEGPVPEAVPAPRLWSELLDLAVDEGIVDADAARRWNQAFQWRQYHRLALVRPLEPLESPPPPRSPPSAPADGPEVTTGAVDNSSSSKPPV